MKIFNSENSGAGLRRITGWRFYLCRQKFSGQSGTRDEVKASGSVYGQWGYCASQLSKTESGEERD